MDELMALGIINKNDTAVVSSRTVAEKFNRDHKHVLETIRELTKPTSGLSKEFIKQNFIISQYRTLLVESSLNIS